jgi:hypothetical protein
VRKWAKLPRTKELQELVSALGPGSYLLDQSIVADVAQNHRFGELIVSSALKIMSSLTARTGDDAGTSDPYSRSDRRDAELPEPRPRP